MPHDPQADESNESGDADESDEGGESGEARARSLAKKNMPTRMDEPTFYKKGVIYCSIPKQKFRIIQALPDYATEASVKWPKGKITAACWAEALSKIDTFKK